MPDRDCTMCRPEKEHGVAEQLGRSLEWEVDEADVQESGQGWAERARGHGGGGSCFPL